MLDRKNIQNLYALSPLQEGMLFHALKEPVSRAYFEQLEFGLTGPLDMVAFASAWQDVVDRHDALRTLFAVKNVPQPLQVVLKHWSLGVATEDLGPLDATAARQRIAAYKADDLAQGFTLTQAPPMRLALFRLTAEHHRVIWSFHHIILDGWSLAIMQREWEALYTARCTGVPLRLPPAPAYARYIRWLESHNADTTARYWAELLAGVSEPTPVPMRLDRRFASTTPAYASGEYRHPLSVASAAALDSLARSQGVTPSTLVQSLWGLLLARLNGNGDAVFATTVAGRPPELPEAANTVGLFINAVPVRVCFADGASFATLLQRVHQQSIAGRDFHHAPLATTLAAHPLRQSLVDHILVFENYPLEATTPHDPRLPRVIPGDSELHEYTHYPFEFQFLPGNPAVLRFRYHHGLFDAAVIAALGNQFEALASRAAADPSTPAMTLAHASSPWTPPRHIALSASFTADPVVDAANSWLRQLALPSRIAASPYNQCLRELADPESLLNRADLGILLLRFSDALRDLADDGENPAARLEERLQATLDALTRRPASAPLLVALLPSATRLDALESRWRQALLGLPRVTLIDLGDLQARYHLPSLFDPQAERLGHIPYTEAGCAALGMAVARRVAARSRRPFKVIAVDCDNTLWAGICGEAGATGVVIGPGHAALQRFLIARQNEGFLIALASKNAAADVWAVFDQHPDMLLQRHHLAAAAINWQPKSVNLRSLAVELNLGIDSFIFLDDNPTECAEVMAHCPEALALALPEDMKRIEAWLALVWAFDQVAVTAEDRERTQMLQAERSRQAAQRQDGNGATTRLDEFLQGIGLVVRVGAMQPHQTERVAQLTQRTNQFNLSGQRRDALAIEQLASTPATATTCIWAVEVADRFGAYGLTGVVIACQDNESLRIDSLLLSCRVLARRVEDALLCALARYARQLGCRRIIAPLVATDRNEPIRRFLQTTPWQAAENHTFVCTPEQVATAIPGITLHDNFHFEPPAAAPAQAAAACASVDYGNAPATEHNEHHAQYGKPIAITLSIENEAALRHGVEYLPLLAAAAGWTATAKPTPTTQRHTPRVGRAPLGESETRIASVWSEVLDLAAVDAETAFQQLGGHSLHAVRVISRLERIFAREIGLGRLYEHDTIAALARWLDTAGNDPAHHAPGIAAAIPPAPAAAADYPLSHSQERIWLLGQLGAPANAYNQCAAYHLRGSLDVAALHAAAQNLIDRHEILRSLFSLQASGPRQKVEPQHEVAFELTEAPHLDLAQLGADIATAGRQPFDLENGPLIRFRLFRRAADDHVLAILLHHIVGDGWSFGLILDELARAYRGQPLPPITLRYRDYAVWSRSPACETDQQRHRDYWRQRLSNLPEIARIPPDFARPSLPSGKGAGLRHIVIADLPVLEAWLAARGAGLFHFLAAAVATLVARLGQQEAVRLGMPVAGRNRPELEHMVGICVNTLVLDAQIGNQQDFTTLLAHMRETSLGALDHQTYPFDRMVADLDPERDTSRNPLFDVMLALQNAPRENAGLAHLAATNLSIPLGVVAFDLVFEFAALDGSLNGSLDGSLVCELSYATDLYRPETAALLLDRLTTLMAAVRATPNCPLAEVTLLSPTEQAQLVAYARGPIRTSTMAQTTLPALFAAQAARTPDVTALITGHGSFEYALLDRRANALAQQLHDVHGVNPGDVVAVLLERSAELPIALLGVLKAGGIYLPLEPSHPPLRWLQLLNEAQARILVTSANLKVALDAAGEVDLPWLDLPCLDPPPAQQTSPPPTGAISPDAPAYLIYTSGSTGMPKGVLVSHRAFINMIQTQIREFALTPSDGVLQLASCAFDASLSEFFMGWLAGATVALVDRATQRDSLALARFIEQNQVTVATFTPSYLQQLSDDDLRPLQRVILAGEAVRGVDSNRLRRLGIVCYNAYGPTETAVCATLGRIDEDYPATAPVPIGRPLDNLTAEILDRHGQPQPIGIPGELVIAGRGVALGYWRRPDLTATRFDTSPAGRSYRTGDLARWLPHGMIEYLGRNDEQIKLRGQRVEPGEVAARIATLEGVSQAAVVCETHGGEAELVAYVCAAAERESALRHALAAQLPTYLLPGRWIFLDRLPLTSSGKLDKNKLPQATPRAPLKRDTQVTPSNPDEAALLALWTEIIGHTAGVEDSFFAVGGNSLKAMHAARLITARLGWPCQAIQLFRTPTVRSLAAALRGQASAKAALLQATLHRLSPAAAQTLIALPPAPGLAQVYAPLAPHLPGWSLLAFDFIDLPVTDLIAHYAQTLLAQDFAAPPTLLGYSAGGRLALALAATLTAAQRPPAKVILVDCWHWPATSATTANELEDPFTHLVDDPAERVATELAATYRHRLGHWKPRQPVTVPVHHLLAETGQRPPPPGFSRNWQACGTADIYTEYAVSGAHYDFLDTAHLPVNAVLLQTVLENSTAASASRSTTSFVSSMEG